MKGRLTMPLLARHRSRWKGCGYWRVALEADIRRRASWKESDVRTFFRFGQYAAIQQRAEDRGAGIHIDAKSNRSLRRGQDQRRVIDEVDSNAHRVF
jgi:hypothetical protein